MNFFGLARRSVFRKPVKSMLLLLIVFAISTLLLAGVASKNASIEVRGGNLYESRQDKK